MAKSINEPKKIGLVFLWNLPEDMQLILQKEFALSLYGKIKKKGGNLKNISKHLDERLVDRQIPALTKLLNNKRITVSFLRKALSFINLRADYKGQHIVKIYANGASRGIAYPKLPFNFNSAAGTRLMAAILHDGSITKNYIFYSKKKASDEKEAYEMRNAFINCAFKIFGKIDPPKSGSWEKELQRFVVYLPTTVAQIMNCLISPEEKKSDTAKIPKFVFNLGKKAIGVFLRQAFDDDGSIYFKGSRRQICLKLAKRLPINSKPPVLLLGDKMLLEKLGIEPSKPILKEKRKTSMVWQINISGMDNLKKFKACVDFNLRYKETKLEKAIESYVQNRFSLKKGKKEFLKAAYITQLKTGHFTISELATKTGRSLSRTFAVVKSFLKKKFVVKTVGKSALGSGKSGLKGSIASQYQLTPKGRSQIKIVLTGGVFDIVHPGHLFTLEQAARLGDALIVVIASDATVKKVKGKNPTFEEKHRLELIRQFKPVDEAIIGDEKNYIKPLEKIKPDIVAFGYDQKSPEKLLKKIKEKYPKTKIIQLEESLEKEKYKTSKIKKDLI